MSVTLDGAFVLGGAPLADGPRAGSSLVFRAGGERKPATPGLSNEVVIEVLP